VPPYSAVMRHHLKYCIQAWDPQHKKDVELLEQVLRNVKTISELKHLFYEKKALGKFHCGLSVLKESLYKDRTKYLCRLIVKE